MIRAIEAHAGHALPGLRESLTQAKAGDFSRIHTPEQIVARREIFDQMAQEAEESGRYDKVFPPGE